jgi:uncharacterized phage protein (TIGR01671 family)
MREIKFRLYHKQLKKFIEPWEFCIDGRGLIFLLGQYKPDFPVDFHGNVGEHYIGFDRYTGLKDKNGKEIYEGDIVKWWRTRTGVIKFGVYDNGERYEDAEVGNGFYFDYGENVSHFYNAEDYEVIGNIYENQELLNAAD